MRDGWSLAQQVTCLPLPFPEPLVGPRRRLSQPKPRASHPAHSSTAPPATPRLTLYGGGGTNQRATSPFRFEAPDARLTPRAPRALIGCTRRRSGRGGGAAEGKGGGEVVARDSLSPARAPAFPGRSASFFSSSVLPYAPSAALGRRASRPNGRPGAPISGRQGASPGAAPANRRGSRPGVGGGSTARPRRRRSSSQPAASERRASRPEVGAPRRCGRQRRAQGGSGGGPAGAAGEDSAVPAARGGGEAGARPRGGGAVAGRASPPPPSRGRRPGPRPLLARRGRLPGSGWGAGRVAGRPRE